MPWYLWATVLILYNDNVNIAGNMKFSSYSSLYCFQTYDKLTYIAIYRGKYLQRRIPHASHGRFNPYIITNKEAHTINGNTTEGNIKNNKTTSVRQLSLETNDNRRHFMNYCLTHPGRYIWWRRTVNRKIWVFKEKILFYFYL